MSFRKITLTLAAGLLTAAMLAMPVMAHGHHGGGHRGHHGNPGCTVNYGATDNTITVPAAETPAAIPPAAAQKAGYPYCMVDGCMETGHHLHDGSYYCGYQHTEGHCTSDPETISSFSHHNRHDCYQFSKKYMQYHH